MRAAANGRVSIVLLLSAALMPFLITAYAVSIKQHTAVWALAFFQSFFYVLCGVLTVRSFGSAGWLVQPMLQFSDSVASILFCWFGLRCFSRGDVRKDLTVCVFICIAAVIMDYFLVSPFLVSLM